MFRIYFSNNVHNNHITQQHINQNNALKIEEKQEKGNSILAMLKNTLLNPGETVSNCPFFHFIQNSRYTPPCMQLEFYIKNIVNVFQLTCVMENTSWSIFRRSP